MSDCAATITVLVAGPSPELRLYWKAQLAEAGAVALDSLNPDRTAIPEAILLTGVAGAPADTGQWIERLRRQWPGVPIAVLPRSGSEDAVIACLRAGAADYIKPPASAAEVLRTMAQWRRPAPPVFDCDEPRLVGGSDAMARVRAFIAQVAPTHANVLITGDTGTGKELIADLIHRTSTRSKGELMRINCAALPEHLLESELFGWTRGAFTGAHASNPGKMEMARGGTVLLDEIGDMSPAAQAKILRLIESREAQRLGGSAVRVDVRFLASTNQDVERLAADGRFRKDLYFRLKVVRINLPRLQEHKEDIPALLDYYVGQMNHVYGRRVEGFDGEAVRAFLAYDWPGNVRELRNLVEAVYVTSSRAVLGLDDVAACWAEAARPEPPPEAGERDRLLAALSSAKWNKSRAARALSWSRMTLYRKMRRYRIDDRAPARAAQAV